EGLNREYSTTILISEATRAAIGDAFVCGEVDRVEVHGRAEAMLIYDLVEPPRRRANELTHRRTGALQHAFAVPPRRLVWHYNDVDAHRAADAARHRVGTCTADES